MTQLRLRFRVALIAAMLLGVFVVAAVSCSGGSNPTSTATAVPATANTNQSTVVPTATTAPTQTAVVATATTAPTASQNSQTPATRSDTLILMFGGPNQFKSPTEANPYAVGANQTSCKCLYGSQLFYYNLMTAQQIPWIGSSWAVATSSDFSEYTIDIKKDVTWSDGVPFTASDVAFTYNMLRDNPKLTGWGGGRDAPDTIKNAVATNDYTIDVTLKHPDPTFESTWIWAYQGFAPFIAPKHIWSQAKDPTTFTNFDLSKGWPVTTGPYTLIESSPQRQVWKERTDWWAAKTGFHSLPAPKELVVVPGVSSSQQLAMILSDEVDAIPDNTVQTVEAAIQRDTNHVLAYYNGTQKPYGSLDWWTTSLMFNTGVAPFNNADFRNAVAYAMNKKQIIEVGMDGAGIAAYLPMAPFDTLTPYAKAVQQQIDQSAESNPDPAKSASLMQGLGYTKDSAGFWSKGGTELQFTISASNDKESDIGPVIVAQLRKAGFNVNYKIDTNLSTDWPLGKLDAVINGPDAAAVYTPTQWMTGFDSKFTAPVGQRAVYASARWNNAQFSQITEQMQTMAPNTDPNSQYMKLWEQAASIYLKELPSIPIRQWQQRNIFNTTYWCGWSNANDPADVFWSRGQDTWWPRHTLMEVLRAKHSPC